MNKGVLAVAILVLVGVVYLLGGQSGLETETSDDAHQGVQKDAAVPPTIGLIDDARIKAADTEPGNWLAFGRNYGETRFSPLAERPSVIWVSLGTRTWEPVAHLKPRRLWLTV